MVVDLSAGISLSPPTVHQGNCNPNYTRTSLIIVLVWFYIFFFFSLYLCFGFHFQISVILEYSELLFTPFHDSDDKMLNLNYLCGFVLKRGLHFALKLCIIVSNV